MTTPQDAGFVAAHDQEERNTVIEHFTGHEKRTESDLFKQTKATLEHKMGFGCYKCLMRHLDSLIAAGDLPAFHQLTDADLTLPNGARITPLAFYNRLAAKKGLFKKIHGDATLESHHFAVEWAHWPQASLDKVNSYAASFDVYGLYAEGVADGLPPISSPDDPRTQMILCTEHHRGEGEGIHHAVYPAWSADEVVRDDEEAIVPPEGHHPVHPKAQFGPHIMH